MINIKMLRHPQQLVSYEGTDIEVDEGIACLLQLLWKEKIKTYNSCQDNMGMIWINMDLEDYKRTVERTRHQNKELYKFFNHSLSTIHYYMIKDSMHWTISLRFNKNRKDEFIKLWIATF